MTLIGMNTRLNNRQKTAELAGRQFLGCLAFLAFFLLPLKAAALQGGLPDFTTLVEDNYTAVVNISTMNKPGGAPGGLELPDLENSPYGDLLKRFLEDQVPDEQPRGDVEPESLGSGFIISEDGYVMTNNHFVAEADQVIVRLHDRRQLVAEVIGTDPRSDIALLKIDAENLPVVKIGESDNLKVGEWVLAIGSPFGFDFSVTAGIVSAKGRALPNESYVPFIQTDVAINPGNSGGPLFNLAGEVIGVNSQIYSRTGGFMGLSFAIPIEMAFDVTNQLRTKGAVSRGWLGVVIQEMTRELAESFGMSRAYGALVRRILPGSPAEQAGFKVGDVITHFNGSQINRSSGLPPLVGRVPIDASAKVDIVREGETMELTVIIAELPGERELRRATSSRRPSQGDNPMRISVIEVPDDLREELQVEEGVLIEEVIKDSPADQAGLIPGDVILKVQHKAVTSLDDFDRIIIELEDLKSIAVLIQRPDGALYVAVQLAP